jgi:hypothetical protein
VVNWKESGLWWTGRRLDCGELEGDWTVVNWKETGLLWTGRRLDCGELEGDWILQRRKWAGGSLISWPAKQLSICSMVLHHVRVSQLIRYGIQPLGLKLLLQSQALCHTVMIRWQLVKHKASIYRSSCLMSHNNAQNSAERPSICLSMNY